MYLNRRFRRKKIILVFILLILFLIVAAINWALQRYDAIICAVHQGTLEAHFIDYQENNEGKNPPDLQMLFPVSRSGTG